MIRKRKTIFIIIPALNEEKKIKVVVDEAAKFGDTVVIVDDGSKDKTILQVKNPKAVILKHCVNLGQGAALRTGLEYAQKMGADIAVTFDADGQFIASEIPKIIKPVVEGKADIVLGSRFLGQTVNMPFSRFITLKLGIYFTYFFSGIKLSDTHNGFRALNRKAIQNIKITHNKMAHSSEIIDLTKKHKLKLIEIPVTVIYNEYSKQRGQSSFNALRICLDLIAKKLY